MWRARLANTGAKLRAPPYVAMRRSSASAPCWVTTPPRYHDSHLVRTDGLAAHLEFEPKEVLPCVGRVCQCTIRPDAEMSQLPFEFVQVDSDRLRLPGREDEPGLRIRRGLDSPQDQHVSHGHKDAPSSGVQGPRARGSVSHPRTNRQAAV